jgi:predicted metal-binding membrane protein
LQSSGLLTPAMQVSANLLAGALLLAAGLWQLTPAKRACLRHCRSPVDFLVRQRRHGQLGAWLVGMSHGGYCVGCCWILMTLLFVGGVMNPYWIAALTLYVVMEKRFLRGEQIGRIAGVALILAGLWMVQS